MLRADNINMPPAPGDSGDGTVAAKRSCRRSAARSHGSDRQAPPRSRARYAFSAVATESLVMCALMVVEC